MLKSFFVILSISLTYQAISLDHYECNYQLLNKRKESYATRIIDAIPVKKDNILENLDFLSLNENIKNKESFVTRNDEPVTIFKHASDLENNILKNKTNSDNSFFSNCMSIYNTESDPIKKEAIIMLVKKVSEELEEYINNVKSITEIFSHSKETKKRQHSGNSKS